MILTPAQTVIAADLHRFRVINCGRRFGKTTLAVEEIKGKALSKPSRIAYIAPTYQQARDIAWGLLKKELLPIATTINESRLEIIVKTVKGGESLIVLRGWESIETLRGQQFDFIIIDEVASMRNFWLSWEEVVRPTLTDTRGECMFISTPKGFNHFYELFNIEQTDTDYKSFHYTTYDNPFIPVDEIAKAQHELPENRFAQEYMADFRKTEGLVYKEFDRARHVYAIDIIRPAEKILGVDFGYTNPTAILEITRDFDNCFWVTSEYYRTGKTTEELIEYMRTLKSNKTYPDPAEPDRIEMMQRAGLNPREVSKDVIAGIDAIRALFKNNRIKIHYSCTNLINELETYTFKEQRNTTDEPEEPVKEHDHAVDALRYALFMQNPVVDYNQSYVDQVFDKFSVL